MGLRYASYAAALKEGERIEIHHPSLPEPATGTCIDAPGSPCKRLVRLDGTDQTVFVPREWIRRPREEKP